MKLFSFLNALNGKCHCGIENCAGKKYLSLFPLIIPKRLYARFGGPAVMDTPSSQVTQQVKTIIRSKLPVTGINFMVLAVFNNDVLTQLFNL